MRFRSDANGTTVTLMSAAMEIEPSEPDEQDCPSQELLQSLETTAEILSAPEEQVCAVIQSLLQQLEQGGAAADYLRSRGISAETAIAWQLGFAGGRLTIPLNDASGQTVGFCGRAMGNQEPKYRNSTGDLLFQRNGLVFGLDQAAEAIRKQGTALLVEGPLDVIQLHQAGFTNDSRFRTR